MTCCLGAGLCVGPHRQHCSPCKSCSAGRTGRRAPESSQGRRAPATAQRALPQRARQTGWSPRRLHSRGAAAHAVFSAPTSADLSEQGRPETQHACCKGFATMRANLRHVHLHSTMHAHAKHWGCVSSVSTVPSASASFMCLKGSLQTPASKQRTKRCSPGP